MIRTFRVAAAALVLAALAGPFYRSQISRAAPPANAQSREVVPASAVRSLQRAFGSPLYLPTWVPDGFVFDTWQFKRHDYDTGNRDSLLVTFKRDDLDLEWGVYAGPDRLGLDCPTRKTAFAPPQLFAAKHGVRVFLNVGVHGTSEWRCIPAHSVGNPKALEVELWYDIRFDTRAMRRRVSDIVAEAQLVRPR